MSILINPILCKNYEDNQSYAPSKHYLKNWPAMWPEEAMADLALYEEHKTMRERFPTFLFDNVQWCIRHCDGKTWAKRVPFALASLVRECGWKIRNTMDMALYNVSPIYETDIRRMECNEEQDPKHDSIEIDMELLAHIMGDMMPIITVRKHRIIVRPPMNRQGIQAYALATLAKDNGWKKEQGTRYSNYRDFYKV